MSRRRPRPRVPSPPPGRWLGTSWPVRAPASLPTRPSPHLCSPPSIPTPASPSQPQTPGTGARGPTCPAAEEEGGAEPTPPRQPRPCPSPLGVHARAPGSASRLPGVPAERDLGGSHSRVPDPGLKASFPKPLPHSCLSLSRDLPAGGGSPGLFH